MQLYRIIVVSPLCATSTGSPLSYESYDFSPTEVLHKLGGPRKYLTFHIYCEELKQIALDKVSNARERKNLANRTERQNKQEICSSSGNVEKEEEVYWGEVVQHMIVRDLRGFGLEHASKPARDLIRRVITISQDNYPEQMYVCYLVNVPWVFNVLWQALQPLISSRNTTNKVLLWDSNFLQALRHEVPLSQLPKVLGGHVDPYKYTTEEMDALLLKGEFSGNVKLSFGLSTLGTSRENSQSTLDDDEEEAGYSSDESSQGSSSCSDYDSSERGMLQKDGNRKAKGLERETPKKAVEFQSFEVDEALEMAVKM